MTTTDPEQTEVEPGGKIADGLYHTWRTRDGKPIDNETLMQARGWGEVARMSYGEFLVWLERNLSPPDVGPIAPPGFARVLKRQQVEARMTQQLQQAGKLTESEIEALAKRCGEALLRFHFPVHACGYNWLRSNQESASKELSRRVDEIMEGYQAAGHRCERVILVTHSMGGLVARYYSELGGGSKKVAGIVHGVMPTEGAAVFYRRMKCGTDGAWPITDVLGATARETTAVLAGAPGPLQLLPTPEYGQGWFKIFKEGRQQLALPTGNDPYTEIYLVRDQWWSMLETELANPEVARMPDGGRKELALKEEWEAYATIIRQKVSKFHAQMTNQFHDRTYLFYSDSAEFQSYGEVSWTGRPYAFSPRTAAGRIEAGTYGTKRWVNDTDARGRAATYEYTISDYDEPGDGTVPVRSAESGAKNARRSLTIAAEHEPAYNDDSARWFSLGAILEIASQIET